MKGVMTLLSIVPINRKSKMIDIIAQIEDYLSGEMQGETRQHFENQIKTNEALAQRVAQHQKLIKGFETLKRRKNLKNRFEAFHTAMEAEGQVPALRRAYSFKAWVNTHYPTMAVAASVAFITVFSTIFTMQSTKKVDTNHQSHYQYLKREVDRLKKGQQALANDIVSAETAPAPASVDLLKFGGTGFAISSDGYVVTNYHLVSRADSIIIEQKGAKKQRLKAKMIYGDAKHDLALLKVTSASFSGFGTLPYTLGQQSANLGEDIFTLAYPREEMVYGEGSISAYSGYEGDTNAYQVSIPVNPGNSGGPLFDKKGNLIGVISGKQTEAEGVAFAQKTINIRRMLNQVPKDSLGKMGISLSKNNKLKYLDRTTQLRKIQDFVFHVKVY